MVTGQMNAEEAITRVEAWLHATAGDRAGTAALVVQREHVVRGGDGWHVPFNAAGYLDGTDIGKGIVPTPTVLVPDDGGEIRYATAAMAQPVDENECADAVPETVWNGYPTPRSRAEELLHMHMRNLIDRPTLVSRLGDTEVLLLLDSHGRPATNQNNVYFAFTSSAAVTAGYTRWRRIRARELAAGGGLVLDQGRPVSAQFHRDELTSWATPASSTPLGVHEVAAEIDPRVLGLISRLAQELGVDSLLNRHLLKIAEWTRKNGYELTVAECERYVRGYAWQMRNARNRQGNLRLSWPEDLAANGLITHYDDHGEPMPVPWTFGKFNPRNTVANRVRFAWHRVVGAYVGFAVGEQAASPEGTPGIGGLTRQLLRTTEAAIRGLPRISEDGAIPPEFPPPARTDSWLTAALATHGAAIGAPSPLTVALTATPAGGVLLDVDEIGYSKAVAHKMAGAMDIEMTSALDTLVWLFHQLLGLDEMSYPVHIRLRELLQAQSPVSELAGSVLALREDRYADDATQIETIGDGRAPLSVLGRALFAAAKRHYDPEIAIHTAVTQSGDRALTGALTGAMAGARFGIPGLPESRVAALPWLGLVENVASDAFWNFHYFGVDREVGALQRWEQQRYPRA